MKTLKIFLKFLFFLVLNLALLLCSLFILTLTVIEFRDTRFDWLGFILIIGYWFAFLYVVYKGRYGNRFYARYGIGLVSVLFSVIFLSVNAGGYYLNSTFRTIGNYETIALYSKDGKGWDKKKYDNGRYHYYNEFDMPLEKWLIIDSLSVRIDKGFLGWSIITDDYKITESNNCEHASLDSSDIIGSHIDIARELTFNRCFSGAIFHYNEALRLMESPTESVLLEKALLHIYYEEFAVAAEAITAAAIFSLSESDLEKVRRKIAEDIQAEDFSYIRAGVEVLDIYESYRKYLYLMDFCNRKLQESEL